MAVAAPKSTNRLRPVVRALIAFVAVDLLVLAFQETWARYSPDDYAERVSDCAAEPREFVIVGGSPVSEGFNTAAMAGFTWKGEALHNGYAVGLPGATTSESCLAAIHSCPTPPRVLIYGITASDLNDGRREPHGPYSLMSGSDWSEWVRERPRSAEWVTRHYLQGKLSKAWALWRYRHGIRMAAAATLDDAIPGTCPEAAREANENLRTSQLLHANRGYAPALGFVHGRYDVAKANHQKLSPFTFLDRYRTGEHLQYLYKLADWAEHHGTDLVLVDMPVTADLEARHPEAFAEYNARLAEVETSRGIRVIRANRTVVELDDTHFADLIHLNEVGAHKLTTWVRERLQACGGPRP